MKKGYRLSVIGAALVAGLVSMVVGLAPAADALAPASCSITNCRAEPIDYASQESYYMGTTLRLTNCVAYAGGSTNSAVQSLVDVTATMQVGDNTTNRNYAVNVQNATAGVYSVDIVVPADVSVPECRLKLVGNTSSNVYIYTGKMLLTKRAW